MPACASPFGFAVPYNFSLTCGFTFGHSAGTCFHDWITSHLAVTGLSTVSMINNEINA